MTSVKALAIIALLVGGTALAVAQGPPTGAYPPVAGGAAGNPAVSAAPGPPGPGVIPGSPAKSAATAPSRTRMAHHTTRHHNKMYMSARGHKGSKLNTTK
jgi:hypothetical protein